MNDLTFSNYENYFSTNHQMTDLNPIIQNVDYDETAPPFHYVSNVSCDISTLSQTASGDQRHQQGNLYSFISNTHEEQTQTHDIHCSSNRANTSVGISNTGNSGNVFGNIPFVQIHTTDVQPQRTNYGNIFRRNISKQEEIKSEPIKSENADAAKERTNATPTPPRATNQTQNENVELLPANQKSPENINNNNCNNNLEDKTSSLLQIYKCSQCPFISLNQTERDSHAENSCSESHQRQYINCPGCSNIFCDKRSLDIHLKLDHLMREEDALKLINTLMVSRTSQKAIQNISELSPEAANKNNDAVGCSEPVRKSRIYLKNVDCLREPNRQPIEQTDNQLNDSNANHSVVPQKNSTKQKISIKSVDVLREPALLRRNYEIPNANLNNFLNFNTDLLNNTLNSNSSDSFEYTGTLENTVKKTNVGGDESSHVNNTNSHNGDIEIGQKTRRPKIYVKSVESFNLMPLNSLQTTNTTAYSINNQNSSSNKTPAFDSNAVHLPYLFDSNSNVTNLNTNNSFINSHNEIDTFQFMSNTNSNFIIDNTLYSGNSATELGENCVQMDNINLISDSATPTPPAAADMNLIMTKPLATAQEQRGTLHLRTVDELNLMNKTEVQHLIAPNLDNNHSGEVVDKINSSSLNDINLIGDDLYGDDNFKFHDLDTQMVNNWPETYEDLAEDIDCIIAHASNENSTENQMYTECSANQRQNSSHFDIDTPQVSLITIRDIEELTGTANFSSDQQQNSVVEQIQECQNLAPSEIDIVSQEPLITQHPYQDSVSDKNLKRELVNTTPESNDASQTAKITKTNATPETTSQTLPAAGSELPPLVPVTNNNTDLSESNLNTGSTTMLPSSNIPMPPLVPVSPLIKLKNVTMKTTTQSVSPFEKGRIYVANNLMEPPKRPVAVSAIGGTSIRGRPFGSNNTRITKLKLTIGSSAEDLFSKCSIKGCAFRFKKPETVEYHRKCHDITTDSPQSMLCPECKSTEFNNWNTLHTHLWRVHQIDMELYKCELCEFKTPIFSRLVNTHAKIHFDDRNYKCEQCEKAFKNSKQLKNHRRWHRVQSATAGVPSMPKIPPPEIHRCSDCGSTFSKQKTLREHCCKKGDSSLKCSICEKLMSSKSSLKLHLLIHSDGEKRYKCQNCDYATNDHNAFRRHRMGHENRKMYECNFCEYKSVQSVAYQKHILQKHPDKADTVIHKCTVCSFATINRSLFIVHKAKHEQITEDKTKPKAIEESSKTTEKGLLVLNAAELQKSKIKVKSNLFSTNVNLNNNELNFVQIYNSECGNVT